MTTGTVPIVSVAHVYKKERGCRAGLIPVLASASKFFRVVIAYTFFAPSSVCNFLCDVDASNFYIIGKSAMSFLSMFKWDK